MASAAGSRNPKAARGAEFLARLVGGIQQGRISIYLTYSFLTLLALLFFVR